MIQCTILIPIFYSVDELCRLWEDAQLLPLALMYPMECPSDHNPVTLGDHFIDGFAPTSPKGFVFDISSFLILWVRYEIRMRSTVICCLMKTVNHFAG